MVKLIAALLDLLDRVGQYIANQQLINAGKAEQQVVVDKKVSANVQKSITAVTAPDDTRDKRLRDRFDTDSGPG